MKVEFLDRVFQTKDEFGLWVRARINALPLGFANPEAREFLTALLERHPDRGEKMGRGIVGFLVEHNTGGGRRLSLQDGSGALVSFSWRKCVAGRRVTAGARMTAAMRAAVAADVGAVRRGLPALCACGQPASEVDHVPPKTFATIRDDFLASTEFKTNPIVDLSQGGVDLERNVRLAWRFFHTIHATLKLVCRGCNQKSWRGQ